MLTWDPDFPEEEAGCVVAELIRGCPRQARRAAADQFRETLSDRTPEWAEMLWQILADSVKS